MLFFILLTSREYNADVPKYHSLFDPLWNTLSFCFVSFWVVWDFFVLVGGFCLFFWPIIAVWGSLLPVCIESRQVFDIQGTILFHLNDYVAIKSFKTELAPTVCELFDEEKHDL